MAERTKIANDYSSSENLFLINVFGEYPWVIYIASNESLDSVPAYHLEIGNLGGRTTRSVTYLNIET